MGQDDRYDAERYSGDERAASSPPGSGPTGDLTTPTAGHLPFRAALRPMAFPDWPRPGPRSRDVALGAVALTAVAASGTLLWAGCTPSSAVRGAWAPEVPGRTLRALPEPGAAAPPASPDVRPQAVSAAPAPSAELSPRPVAVLLPDPALVGVSTAAPVIGSAPSLPGPVSPARPAARTTSPAPAGGGEVRSGRPSGSSGDTTRSDRRADTRGDDPRPERREERRPHRRWASDDRPGRSGHAPSGRDEREGRGHGRPRRADGSSSGVGSGGGDRGSSGGDTRGDDHATGGGRQGSSDGGASGSSS